MKNRVLIIFSFLLLFFLISCSARYIRINHLDDYLEAKQGDTLTLNWDISNADYVKISNSDNKFALKDKFKFVADTSTILKLTAYHGKRDSISRKITINIKQVGAISGFNFSDKFDELQESIVESDYFTGLRVFSDSVKFSRIKITGVDLDIEKNQNYKLKFILLDRYGNFINNFDLNKNGIMLSLTGNYGFDRHTHIFNKIKKNQIKDLGISILIDNSSSNSNQKQIFEGIEKFFGTLDYKTKVSLSLFNHRYMSLIKTANKNEAISLLKEIDLKPSGLNSLYDGINQEIMELSKQNNEKKLLIVIANNSDNTSIANSYQDCLEKSKRYGIPIYFIIMSDFVQSYTMKYLAYQSGGYVYYKSDIGENFDLYALLREIELSNRYSYELKAPLYPAVKNHKIIKISLNMIQQEYQISDHVDLYVSPYNLPLDKKIIATYYEGEFNIKEDFANQIFTLAQILIENPDKKIRLMGHSSKNESFYEAESLSQKRAEELKNKLILLGVKNEQIETISYGNTKPIYFIEEESWQKEINQRVEFKWIEPSALPYEIVAQKTNSEYSALKLSEEWEKQGFRSYFDRIDSSNEPLYRVKLWGFPTKETAYQTIQKLQKKYNLAFEIE